MQSKKNIPCISVALLSAFLITLLTEGCENKKPEKAKSQNTFPATGFADYDLLPVAIKKEIRALQQKDSLNSHQYFIAYYFDIDDMNHRYYIKDAGHDIIKQMPVTNPVAMDLVEEYIAQNPESGYYVAQNDHTDTRQDMLWVTYTLPQHKEAADFSKLRVAILKMNMPPDWITTQQNNPGDAPNGGVYALSEVDEPPEPIGGMEYFKEVVMDEIKRNASFLYQDQQGEVIVTFMVGPSAKSPQVVKGFSTRSESHDAYRMDGAVIKAVNDSKVHWKLAKKDGKYVSVQLAMTFSFNKENQDVLLSMSEWPEAKQIR